MKKLQRIGICIITIAVVLGLASIAYAACSHDSYYWDVNQTVSYVYSGPNACFETTYWDIECKICGECWETVVATAIVAHNWFREDLGHIPGQPLHRYRTTCSQCGYSVITEEFCPLTH
ncbi:MAG: hypothetical protein GX584_03985 [Clostridiaceae bacterium]|jgi:hypothetical protein|nr:hypothetical protein [Clostridiaceae bacterium]